MGRNWKNDRVWLKGESWSEVQW